MLTPRQSSLLVVALSALFFYFNSAVVSWGVGHTTLTTGDFTVGRFVLGFILVSVILTLRKEFEAPQDYRYLTSRAVFNFLSIIGFFEASARSGPIVGNTLNLLYPVFLLLFALRKFTPKELKTTFLATTIGLVGVVLVLKPCDEDWGLVPSLYGLSSGFFAALSVQSLKAAREKNSAATILLWLFGIGSVLSLILFGNQLHSLNGTEIVALVTASALGTIAQYYLTLGALHISASESGLMSLARIPFALVLGPLIGIEGVPTISMIAGAFIVLGTNAWVISNGGKGKTVIKV